MEYMNCGWEVSFNREVYYVGTAKYMVMNLWENCKNT
jgi:hypothetical protein